MLLLIGNNVVNSEHVTAVGLDCMTRRRRWSPRRRTAYILILKSSGPAWDFGSPEAEAVRWWFTMADRSSYLPGVSTSETTAVTVDLLAEHRKSLAASSVE